MAFSQTCQNHKVICDEGEIPCCEKFKPHCKDGEPKCCKKKDDGSLKCKDKEENTYPVECKESCDENVVEDESESGTTVSDEEPAQNESNNNEDASLKEKEVNLKALITNNQVLQVLLGYCTSQCPSGRGALVSKQLAATSNDQQACNNYAGVQANGFPNGLTWINTCNSTAGTAFYNQARNYLIQQCLQSYPNQTIYCTGLANNELATYTCCCDNPPVAPLPCGGNNDLVCASLTNHAPDNNCVSGCCTNGTVSWAGYCCPNIGRYSICPGGGCCNIDTHICQGSRCCPQGKACCGNDPPQNPCNQNEPCCPLGSSCSNNKCCPSQQINCNGTCCVSGQCTNPTTGTCCNSNNPQCGPDANGNKTCCPSGQCLNSGICCSTLAPYNGLSYSNNNGVCCINGYIGCPNAAPSAQCCNYAQGYTCPTAAGGTCIPPTVRTALPTPTPVTLRQSGQSCGTISGDATGAILGCYQFGSLCQTGTCTLQQNSSTNCVCQ